MTGVSRTGSKHDGKTRSWSKTLISVFRNYWKKPEAREIFLEDLSIHLEFIKNIQRIRMGAEKYSGLIAGQKFTRRVEIAQRNREARGGLI